MGVTSEGIVYADSTHNTRIWELDQEQADSINTQLAATRAKPVVNVFTANGVWNKPAGAKRVRVRCKGGGGAGGGVVGAGTGQSEGAYGASGGWVEKWFDASELAASITVTIGAGGTGVSGAAGNNGGSTTFAHTVPLVAGGGGGGAAMSSTTTGNIASGGTGGSATGGDINAAGANGAKGRVLAGSAVLIGRGGDGMLGRGAGGLGVAGAGTAAAGYGAGGGGAFGTTVNFAGGAGSAGICIVETFK